MDRSRGTNIDDWIRSDIASADVMLTVAKRRHFERLVQNDGDEGSDVEVITQKLRFRLHKNSLAQSSFLATAISKDTINKPPRVDLQDANPDAVEAVLKYLYTSGLFTTLDRGGVSGIDISSHLTCIPVTTNYKVEWLFTNHKLFVPLVDNSDVPTKLPMRKDMHDLTFYIEVFALAEQMGLQPLQILCQSAFTNGVSESRFFRESLRGAFQGVNFIDDPFFVCYFRAIKRLYQIYPTGRSSLHVQAAKATAMLRSTLMKTYNLAQLKADGWDHKRIQNASRWNTMAFHNKQFLSLYPAHFVLANDCGDMNMEARLSLMTELCLEPVAEIETAVGKRRTKEELTRDALDVLRCTGRNWEISVQNGVKVFKVSSAPGGTTSDDAART
ncbi:MAG: hypothetical protein M1828_004030 [Chrysothrix sp. TS-e1954]|nr:MAG: hypothetical protein M1828_004030 [Chrysothrix sp. TS-e1954]